MTEEREAMLVEAHANEHILSFSGAAPTTRPGRLAHASFPNLLLAHELAPSNDFLSRLSRRFAVVFFR